MGRGAPCRPIGGSGVGSSVSPIDPDMGPVCGPRTPSGVRLSSPIPDTRLISGGGGGPPYFSPDFDVMGLRPADGLVKTIMVDETSGFDLPVCRVILANVDKRLSSSILAKEQSSFQLRLGWNNPGMQDHGTFVVQRPRFRFNGGAGSTEVEIVAYGEQVRLAATERREVYRKMRDSDIARVIAARHGFEADVDRTDPVHDQVIQANESDYKFLARRALLHGLLVMVEDGVLRFHAPRPCESGIILTCQDPLAGIGNFSDFTVESRTFQRGLRLRLSQIDPVTKEEFDLLSGEAPDSVQRNLRVGNWSDLVSIPGIGQPERFLVNEGHEQRREQLRGQINRMAESTRYVVFGSGGAVGLETLRPQRIITMAGIGKSNGRYIVTRVTHRISVGDGRGFETRFEVVRSGAEEFEGRDSDGELVPMQIESAGTVFASPAAQAALAGL